MRTLRIKSHLGTRCSWFTIWPPKPDSWSLWFHLVAVEPLSRTWQKKRGGPAAYTPREGAQKGRAVTPRDRSQSNVSVTFRFHVAVCRVHKGSPFKYAGMKFNPQHPFPAPLCLAATIGASRNIRDIDGKEQRSLASLLVCFLCF